MIVDKGVDFPPEIDAALKAYGEDMWLFRDQSPAGTTRALNQYKGDHRGCATLFACLLRALFRSIAATHHLPLFFWALVFWPLKKFSVPHP